MLSRTDGTYTVCAPPHCGACIHGNDRGILGAPYTCAIDGVDRNAWENCPTPEQFVLDTRPVGDRYPAYGGEDFTRKITRDARALAKIVAESATNGTGGVVRFGNVVGIQSRWAAMRAGDGLDAYNVPAEAAPTYIEVTPAKVLPFPAPKDGAA